MTSTPMLELVGHVVDHGGADPNFLPSLVEERRSSGPALHTVPQRCVSAQRCMCGGVRVTLEVFFGNGAWDVRGPCCDTTEHVRPRIQEGLDTTVPAGTLRPPLLHYIEPALVALLSVMD